jgi:hypothetical protein
MICTALSRPIRARHRDRAVANQPMASELRGKGLTDPVMPDVRTPCRSVLSLPIAGDHLVSLGRKLEAPST